MLFTFKKIKNKNKKKRLNTINNLIPAIVLRKELFNIEFTLILALFRVRKVLTVVDKGFNSFDHAKSTSDVS